MTIPLFLVIAVYGSVLLIIVTSIFLVAQVKSDNSIMDIAYGPSFLLAGSASAILLNSASLLTLLLILLTAIWSMRLAFRIYRKNHGQPEDARYAAWRTDWSKHGKTYFLVRSYLQINVLQGLIIGLVSFPLIVSLAQIGDYSLLTPLSVLGVVVFLIGITIESLADYQLDNFIARKRSGTEPALFMKTGLFKYSRRPNYFGESLVWWGMTIIALQLPYGFLALISPIVITFIVTRVTGPMLEKLFIERYGEEYVRYQNETSYFIPRPKKGQSTLS